MMYLGDLEGFVLTSPDPFWQPLTRRRRRRLRGKRLAGQRLPREPHPGYVVPRVMVYFQPRVA